MGEASERAIRIAEEINKRTSCEHYRLVLNEERQPKITDSKIGGLPYWPEGKDLPVDDKGNKMLMVLQVNCAEAGLKAPLPEQGMLQWFISTNAERMFGCKGNYDEDGSGFAVVYHETVNGSCAPADVPTHETVDEMLTPVKRETAIDVVKEGTAMGVTDGGFNSLFFGIVKEITGVEHQGKMWYQYMDNDDCLHFEKNMGMKRPRHQMLGYPVFTQDDARRDIRLHDTLLFQLDSQFSTADSKELVMWGDMGSGFIFINRDDLAARNFSRAYYCWDCG
ncbi:MAG: DUF1963 domain-containing protein [Muribaculaceae bacterium]|nr:DUF1963 domain-containing protein [Muribaculaceae bacterium]